MHEVTLRKHCARIKGFCLLSSGWATARFVVTGTGDLQATAVGVSPASPEVTARRIVTVKVMECAAQVEWLQSDELAPKTRPRLPLQERTSERKHYGPY